MTATAALARVENALAHDPMMADALAAIRKALTPKKRARKNPALSGFTKLKFPAHVGLGSDGAAGLYRTAMGRNEDRTQYSPAALAQFRENAR